MKKIGILFGAENSFPSALVQAINTRAAEGTGEELHAEFVQLGAERLDGLPKYQVILDRISHQIPFYRSMLKHAVMQGTVVVNHPFWCSADDKLVNHTLAERLGVATPKTALLPQKKLREGDERMLRNLEYPLDWASVFAYTGFPAYLKPVDGGGWRNVSRVNSREELFDAYDRSGELCMLLQEAIEYSAYYRCLVAGQAVRIAAYDPRAPHHERFTQKAPSPEPALARRLEQEARKLSKALGYECNTVEFAVRDGVPYAIDFMNPAPDFDLHSLGREHFDWTVGKTAELLIELAATAKPEAPARKWPQLLLPPARIKAKPQETAMKSSAKKKAGKKASNKAGARKKAGPKKRSTGVKAVERMASEPFAAQALAVASIRNMASTATSPQTRTLGNSDLQLTSIGFGAWAIGGGNWQFGWGSQDDEDSVSTIERALDLGINWIDTAAVYGLGRSEEVVGRAVKNSGKRPYIFTKCSMRWDDKREIYHSLKAASLQEELENSLRRLQVETIDLYQIHWPDPEDELEEGWETLAKFQKQGKVRYFGASNFTVEQLKRVQKIAPVTSLQPPYSLVNPAVEKEILPYCEQQNIGVINYSPMASGLLTGKMTAERVQKMPEDDWRRHNPNFQEPKLSRNLKLAELLREIGKDHGVQPGVVAIAWTLRNPAVTAAIVGARRPDQVDGILPALRFRLSEDEIARIGRFLAEHP